MPLEKEPGRGSAPTVYYDPDEEKRPDGGVSIAHSEPHRLTVHNVGGREPDGSPTYIGPWTFDTKMVRDVVERWIEGRVLNACAGETHLSHEGEIVRNDLNPDRDADVHQNVTAIDDVFAPNSFDSVVFDPPFDQTQADDHYDGMHDRHGDPPGGSSLNSFVLVGCSSNSGGTITGLRSQSMAGNEKSVTGIGVAQATSQCFSPLIIESHAKRH